MPFEGEGKTCINGRETKGKEKALLREQECRMTKRERDKLSGPPPDPRTNEEDIHES